MTHFHHSSVATAALLSVQRKKKEEEGAAHTKPLRLIQDVATRWNSTYMMLIRLIKLRIPVLTVLIDESITKPTDRYTLDLKDTWWRIAEDLIPILEPMAEVTEHMTKETEPTIGSCYKFLAYLIAVLEPTELDLKAIGDVKKTIRDDLQTRFRVDDGGVPVDPTGLRTIGALLDPRMKSLRSWPMNSREVAQDTLISCMSDIDTEESTNNQPTIKVEPMGQGDSSGETKGAKRKLLDLLASDVIDLTKTTHHNNSAERELESYLTEPVYTDQPLLFWQMNEAKFPRLSLLARKHLATPATEVASERSFSAAGLTVSTGCSG